MLYLIFSILSAICFSYSTFFLHELRGKVDPLLALQYTYLMQILIISFLLNFQSSEDMYRNPPIQSHLAMLGFISCTFISQNFKTRAAFLKKASYIMPFGYLGIVMATISDEVFFDVPLDWLSLIGMFMASAGLLIKIIVKE